MQDLSDLSQLENLDIYGAHGAKPYGYVYCITNQINGKKYVGQTVYTVEDRFKRHLYDSSRGSDTSLHRSIRKYGAGSFSVRELFRCHTDQNDLNAAENYYIYELGTIVDDGNGYNMTWGGEGGKRSEEARNKMSVAQYQRKVPCPYCYKPCTPGSQLTFHRRTHLDD